MSLTEATKNKIIASLVVAVIMEFLGMVGQHYYMKGRVDVIYDDVRYMREQLDHWRVMPQGPITIESGG